MEEVPVNYVNIISALRTRKASLEFIRDLDSTINLGYMSKDVSFTKHLSDLDAKLPNLLQWLDLVGYEHQKNRELVIAALEKLRDALSEAPCLKLTLAFTPDPSFTEKLYSWFAKNYRKSMLLDFNVDPNILGGVVVSTSSGNYMDLSLSAFIDKYFISNKQNVLSSL